MLGKVANGGYGDEVSRRIPTLVKGRRIGASEDDQAYAAEQLFKAAIRKGLRRVMQDNLAELVANGAPVIKAGASLGLTKGQTARMWSNIKAGLGGQAC